MYHMNTESKNIKFVEYICGKCGAINEIYLKGRIFCNVCFFNILFKKRNLTIKRVKAV